MREEYEMSKYLLFVSGIVFFIMISSSYSVSGYSFEMINQINREKVPNHENEFIGNPFEMGPDWYHKPSSYAELVSWYQSLEDLYPDYLEVFKANDLYGTGVVSGGYDLYFVRITNESLGLHKPEVFFMGSPHGDETVGTIGLYWFTDWLMRMAFTDETNQEHSQEWLQWIIDNREIYIEVSHNPYGFDQDIRYDYNGWDLNREADYDGPGTPTGGIWASVNGKTVRAFIDNHVVRVGCDFHGGTRMLIYPWADTHSDVSGTSPITGYTYGHAPPDFYYYDASSLRLGDYIGDYDGDLDKDNIGTISEMIWYSVKGGLTPWAYAADVEKNPVEDPYVNDEIFGNYPGTGILWVTPEMSYIKNPPETAFGNDTVHRFGAEVRRYVLHQTDLAQPYLKWQPGTIEDDSEVLTDTGFNFTWKVNGCVVVDHTSMQWGTDADPINNPQFFSEDHDEHAGDYIGGTGWDNAENGQTDGVTYNETIIIDTPGDYYFVAKAQVDQIYQDILRPDVYGDNPYLRIIKERTDESYYEVLEGTDGTEEIFGQSWWYSPIIHVKVLLDNEPPLKPDRPDGPTLGSPGVTYLYVTKTTDVNGDRIYYMWDWGNGNFSEWIGPSNSGEIAGASYSWDEKGTYSIRVKAKDESGAESEWSDPLSVRMPMNQLRKVFFQNTIKSEFYSSLWVAPIGLETL